MADTILASVWVGGLLKGSKLLVEVKGRCGPSTTATLVAESSRDCGTVNELLLGERHECLGLLVVETFQGTG